MKKLFNYSLIIIFISFLGCETVVDIDVPFEEPKLVLNGHLSTNEPIIIHVSKNKHVLDGEMFVKSIDIIEGATVKIYRNDQLLTTITEDSSGFYKAKIFPESGYEYRIEVEKEGFESAYAVTQIPKETAKITSVDFRKKTNDYSTVVEIDLRIEDEKSVSNFYEVSVYTYRDVYDYSVFPAILIGSVLHPININTEDVTFDEYESSGRSLVFDDKLFDGDSYKLKFNVPHYFYHEDNLDEKQLSYTVALRNTSESHYLYKTTSAFQSWVEGDPFAEPVQVYNNVENGLGILSGFNEVSHEIKF